MNINKLNYEIYFLDYYEGNLSAEQTADLMIFLEQHADLKIEFEEFENIAIEVPAVYLNKDSLKKNITPVGPINEENYDEFLIENIEGIQTHNNELEQFIKTNPFLEKELNIYYYTILQADKTITFLHKENLKKTVVIKLIYKQLIAYSSIAALFIFGIFIFNKDIPQYKPNKILYTYNIEPDLNWGQTAFNFNNKTSTTIIPQPKIKHKSIIQTKQNSDYIVVNNEAELAFNNKEKEDIIVKTLPTEKSKINLQKPIELKTNSTTLEESHLSPKELIASTFRKKVLKRENKSNEKLSALEIAEAGINTFNKILGSNLSIAPKYDEQGEMTAYAISSDRFGMEKSVKK